LLKKLFLGAGCGVWGVGFGRELLRSTKAHAEVRTGVGFYPFSGRSAKLSRVDGEPVDGELVESVEPPWSIT